jgi:hypothetical protein
MACEIINRKLAAHIGKYDGLFARLCLLWHCIEEAAGLTVDEHIAQRVADFMHHFLLPHATAFYADMLELSDDHDRLTQVASYILAHKLSRVTNRDVQRGSRAMRGLQRLEVEGIFEQLEALGWLMRTPSPYRTTPLHGKSTRKCISALLSGRCEKPRSEQRNAKCCKRCSREEKMPWNKEEWDAYKAWIQSWIREHEHELPSRVRTKNGRWVPLGKKHRWRFAQDAWSEMQRQVKAAARRALAKG